MKKPRSPIAVLISDIHYNINTLPVADAALRQAIAKANELDVVLIVTGDLHDTKANLARVPQPPDLEAFIRSYVYKPEY